MKDHAERSANRLLTQLQDKPRFNALLRLLVKPFQELESVFWDLMLKRSIDAAEGAQLDMLGRILDEPRGPLSDEDYRAVLRVKVLVLKSSGTGPELIEICERMLQSSSAFTLSEYFPAAIEVQVLSSPTFALSLLKRFLRRAKSAGVRLDVVDATGTGPGTTFTYDTGPGYDVGLYAGLV